MEIYETVGHTNTVHFYGVSKGKTTIVRYLFILIFHQVQYAVEQQALLTAFDFQYQSLLFSWVQSLSLYYFVLLNKKHKYVCCSRQGTPPSSKQSCVVMIPLENMHKANCMGTMIKYRLARSSNCSTINTGSTIIRQFSFYLGSYSSQQRLTFLSSFLH